LASSASGIRWPIPGVTSMAKCGGPVFVMLGPGGFSFPSGSHGDGRWVVGLVLTQSVGDGGRSVVLTAEIEFACRRGAFYTHAEAISAIHTDWYGVCC
jgi:hypothetical protein